MSVKGASGAWAQLIGALGSLVALTVVLPLPWAAIRELSVRPAGSGSVVDTALMAVLSVLVWVLLLWGSAVAAGAALSHLPGRVGRRSRMVLRRIVPAAARRLLTATVGVSLMTGLAACGDGVSAGGGDVNAAGTAATSAASTVGSAANPAADAPHPAGSAVRAGIVVEGSTILLTGPAKAVSLLPGTPAQPTPAQIDGWGHVDRAAASGGPGGSAAIRPGVATPPPAPGPDSAGAWASTPALDIDWPTQTAPESGKVVVTRGDTLWAIAAAHLPAGATAADIDSAWHRWYAANGAVIGPDPNLILPGQELRAPTAAGGVSS